MEEISFSILLASKYPLIVSFLSQPEVDTLFVLPLSQRKISVEQRVTRIVQSGIWILASIGERIIGCRGIEFDQVENVVKTSTLVVYPTYQGQGIGTKLVSFSISVALHRYNPRIIRYDTWSTNKISKALAVHFGFTKVKEYDDPCRRPPGIKTIVYEKHYR